MFVVLFVEIDSKKPSSTMSLIKRNDLNQKTNKTMMDLVDVYVRNNSVIKGTYFSVKILSIMTDLIYLFCA